MAIIRRTRQTSSFVTLANAVARDRRLTHRARGVLIYILSLPPDATVSSDELAQQAHDLTDYCEGRDAIRTAMKELSAVGYARLEKRRDNAGRISSEWHVSDEAVPATENQATVKTSENEPGPEKPTPVEPTPVKPAPYKKHLPKTAAAATEVVNDKFRKTRLADSAAEERRQAAVDLLTNAGIKPTKAIELAELGRDAQYIRRIIHRAKTEAQKPAAWIIKAITEGGYEADPTPDELQAKREKEIASAVIDRVEAEARLDREREAESIRRFQAAQARLTA